jgi:hypothetical protein
LRTAELRPVSKVDDARRPQARDQFFARDRLSGPGQELLEDQQRLILQANPATGLRKLAHICAKHPSIEAFYLSPGMRRRSGAGRAAARDYCNRGFCPSDQQPAGDQRRTRNKSGTNQRRNMERGQAGDQLRSPQAGPRREQQQGPAANR